MRFSRVKAVILAARDGDRLSRNKFPPELTTGKCLEILHRYELEYSYCEVCKTFSTQEHTETCDGQTCEDCLEEDYFSCEKCGAWERRDDNYVVTVNDRGGQEEWCQSCVNHHAFTCYECEEIFAYHGHVTRVSTASDDLICGGCYDDQYFTCDDCDQVVHESDYGEDGRCISCCDDRRRESNGVIKDYSTKAQHTLDWGQPEPLGRYVKDKLWFGAELEMEAGTGDRNAAAEALHDEFRGEIILCADGSLNDGFEVKTPPLNMDDMAKLLRKVARMALQEGMVSHDGGRCGLHVHVTRAALSPLQQGKIFEFLNKKGNRPLIRALARRYTVVGSDEGRGGYCRVDHAAKRKDISKTWRRVPHYGDKPTHKDKCACTKYVTGVNSERYSAVNFCPDTVELRLFRGTLKETTLLACLEFTWALTFYTRTGACKNNECTQEEFLAWLAACPFKMKKMGHLVRFLVAKKFLPESILPTKKPEGPQIELFVEPAIANPDSMEVEDEAA